MNHLRHMRLPRSKRALWETTPEGLRQLLGLPGRWFSPAAFLGRRYRDTQHFVDLAQWWSAERAAEYQVERLRSICALAQARTPFYRRRFAEAGFDPRDLRTPGDLAHLPTIGKVTLRQHLHEMGTVPPTASSVEPVSTGGSSGEPLHFYIDTRRSATEYAYLVASWQRAGYDLTLPQAVIRGHIVRARRGGLRQRYDPILRRHYYSGFHMNDENLRRYVEHMRTVGACYLHVYPSTINVLTRFLERSGLEPPRNVRGVLAGSEEMHADIRAGVERVWGVPCFSWYGHSEKLVLAAECEHSHAYHVWPTYGYFELLDARGRAVRTPGERGEIVGTGFINTAVPFIRYRTGDYATYLGERCAHCCREHVLIADIEGRGPQGCLVAHDGALVSMTAINVHDDTFAAVREYQFWQRVPGEAVLRVVPVNGFGTEERTALQRRISTRLQGQVRVSVELCQEIRRTARGKLVWVVQETPGVAADGGNA